MNDIRGELIAQYERAMERHIKGAGESALAFAYELGRRAPADGLEVLEMGELHHQTLAMLLSRAVTPEETVRTVKASAELFAESMAPFEMTHRGFREANATLRRLNEILEQEAGRIAHALHDETAQLLAPVHIVVSEVMPALSPAARKHQTVARRHQTAVAPPLPRAPPHDPGGPGAASGPAIPC